MFPPIPTTQPKILVIGPTPPPYHGVAVSTRLILDSPALNCFRLLHLDTTDRRSIENIGTFEWGNIILGLWHALLFLILIVRQRPDLVYLPISQGLGGYLRDLTFLLPARWLRTPAVVHLRGSEFHTFYAQAGRPMQALIRYSLATTQRVIVLGASLRRVFEGLVPAERVVVVPNGTRDFTASLPCREHRERVRGLFLSNLRPRKGVFVALEAAVQALERFPQLEFVFAGGWELEADRQRACDRLAECGVADRILFPGVVVGEQKHQLLLDSDFLVFPPIEPEGQPRVVLEAMAAGLPVITTDQGAIAETVVEGETGFVVATGDVAAIVERIALVLEQPERRRGMSAAARARFLAHYTAEASNAQLAQVFWDVLGGR